MSAFAQESKELTTLVAALSTKGTDADACAASVAKTLAASPAAFVGVAAALEVVFAEKLVEAKLGALKVVQAVTAATGASTAPLLVAFLPHVFAMYSDKKGAEVRALAPIVAKAIFDALPEHAVSAGIDLGMSEGEEAALGNAAKWQSKVGALEILSDLAGRYPKQVKACLPRLVPLVADAMWETKKQVKEAAKTTMSVICKCIGNADLVPFVEDMVDAIVDRDQLTDTIDELGSTTFVQPFDAAALSLATPILEKGFKRLGETAVQRKCAVITENMAKLVFRPNEVTAFAETLLPFLVRGLETISDPEARERFEKAHEQVLKVRDTPLADGVVKSTTRAAMTKATTKALKLAEKTAAGAVAVEFACAVAVGLSNDTRSFLNEDWEAALASGLVCLVDAKAAAAASVAMQVAAAELCGATVNEVIIEESKSKEDDDQDADLPDLCDLEFSLAYGTNILLNGARLHLKKGLKYGIIASKSAGKTTMMRAITNGQVDGFPTKEEVRTVFVENDIQGEQLEMNVVEYVIDTVGNAEPVSEEVVKTMLTEIGYTADMQAMNITALSGGWKMKLALGRATLQKADIMLMDEPTNHLDVINVQWVVDYLNSEALVNTTCMIVSHDTKFLDQTVTEIIHFDNLKLTNYKGNITDFVTRFPWAKSYFELGSSQIKFHFPEPATLMGAKGKPVKKGSPLMSMKNVSFTYPRAKTPQLTGVSVQLSMVSRVAIVGANGAGKSTMIKLLTGEFEPAGGLIKKNANMRFAYVAQHAFHHIEQHLDKTPNQYIRWRYETGEDKEELRKETVVVTEEEKKKMAEPFEVTWKDEVTEKHMKEKRVIEKIVSRKTDKKKFVYELKYVNKSQSFNTWNEKEFLVQQGWEKPMRGLDARLLALEGMMQRPLTSTNVDKHLVNVGLESEYGTHSRISDLSGGQKVKVVLAACTWACPHIIILDEPTNYLDRDSLGALATAILEFGGGVCLITHHKEFAEATTRETWVVANNKCDVTGDPEWEKYAAEDHAMDEKDEYEDASGNTHKIKVVIKLEDMSKKDVKKYKKIVQNKVKAKLDLDEQEQIWADAWDINFD